MENKQARKEQGSWYWDILGWLEPPVTSVTPDGYNECGEELLKCAHEKWENNLSDMDLQDVHYNLPIGSNRKKMENNIVNLLREDVDNSPLSSYSTIAEDDKFVIVGDTQSNEIRAYRKLSEEEVSKALTDYAKHNDISIAPMDKELQELASKILVKSKEQIFYSEVASLIFPGEIREFEDMRKKNDFKGMFKYAKVLDHGDAISQRVTFSNPVHYQLDELLKENDKYAIIYNHQNEVNYYSIFRKVTEEDVRRAVAENGLDPYASADVKDFFNRYLAEKTSIDKRKSTNYFQDNVLREETISRYKKENTSSDKICQKGYVVWDRKDFPEGYHVQPLSRDEFPLVGHLPLCPKFNVEDAKENSDKPYLMFDVGNERLALYILSKAGTENIDKQRFVECVNTFNQIRTLYEENKAKTPVISGVDKSSVDNDIAKGYFYINIQTPNKPTDSYTMVMSPCAVSHGYRSENQLAYAESRNIVVLRTTQKELDQISSKQKDVVSSMSDDTLDDELKGALSRLNRNLGMIKDTDTYTHFQLYQDRFKRDAIKVLGRIEAIYERTLLRDAKQVEGMYYFDSLHEDYVSIGKLRYDENTFTHYKFDTPKSSVNAYAIIDDYHEGLLKTKEQVGEIYTKLKYNNNEQNTLSMPQKKEPQVKQERAAQEKQDASSVEKTAKVKLPEDSSLKYNVFLNGAADHMSKEDMDAYFKMTPKEKDAYLAKLGTKQSKAEKQHRPPQMVTVNGQKVTHAHAFQSNKNPEDWFFTAKLDGQQLRPQIMTKEDVKAYHEKDIKVEELMQHYYPTKLAKKITPEEYKNDTKLSDGRTVDRMVVYKEQDENRPDVGKYKQYAQVGDKKMSRTMSKEDLNAYFDRVTTPAKLVEKNFGEQLHMASAYKKYQLPENSGVERVSIHKNSEGRYVISANMGDKGITPERKMEWNDLYSYFTAKTATREQLAAKYLMSDIRAMHSQKNDVSRGLKI